MYKYVKCAVLAMSLVGLAALTGCSEKIDESKLNPENEPEFEIVSDVDGYSAKFIGDYEVDTSLEGIRTRLYNEETTIDIYMDDLKGTIDNKDTLFNYANEAVLKNPDHEILVEEREEYKKMEINRIEWKRKELTHVENDQSYYASYEIAKNKHKVYTVLIKSSQKITDEHYEFIKYHFKMTDATKEPANIHYPVVEKQWNEETAAYYNTTFGDDSQLQFGLFDASYLNDLQFTEALEEKIDYKFNTLLRYQNIGIDEFPMEEMQAAYEDGRTVELTLQSNNDESLTYAILDGKYDDYLKDYAANIKAFGHPILFRLNNEMNGDWVYYSAYHNSKDPDLYIQSWRYVHDLFEEAGVDNLLWVWNPNHHSKPNYKWNHTLAYYPGSDYVDIIGLTAYNTGNYYEGETWNDFETLYDEIYEQYDKWFDHPFMITEFSSSSIGGDKVKWMDDMFKTISKYERIKVAVFWSWQDLDADGQPARIYFIDENEEVIDAMKRGLSKY